MVFSRASWLARGQGWSAYFSLQRAFSSCQAVHVFAQPDCLSVEPYYELPFPISKLRSLIHFNADCHFLPIEQDRLVRLHVPRQLRRCTLCATCALGDERCYVFHCPHFAGLCPTHAQLFQDASGAMTSLVWHKDQQAVCTIVGHCCRGPSMKTDSFS